MLGTCVYVLDNYEFQFCYIQNIYISILKVTNSKLVIIINLHTNAKSNTPENLWSTDSLVTLHNDEDDVEAKQASLS
jgi:hypothetical protein